MTVQELLIVDDESVNLAVLHSTLSPYYHVRACKSGEQALDIVLGSNPPDLVLLDIVMPGLDGYATLERIRSRPDRCDIPVLFITALDSALDEERGFSLGAVDYITKPFRPTLVLSRVRAQLELKQARDVLRGQNVWLEGEVSRRMMETQLIQDAMLTVLTQLAETRDSDTGNHILRTSAYVERLCRHLSHVPGYEKALDTATIRFIVKASPLHDIGKIGIPDAILLKPGKLTPEEFTIMKTHCRLGGQAIRNAMTQARTHSEMQGSDTPLSLAFLEIAETIATHHHERWDGTGYPDGLSDRDIPLPARVMALADVFDALTTPRIYKQEWHMTEAVAYIQRQSNNHFDPAVVDAFAAELDAFTAIHDRLGDTDGGTLP